MRHSITVIPFLCVALTVQGCEQEPRDDRQAEVAAAGALVMPFDLDRSTHTFEKTDFGGVQSVVSDDGDADQTRLIREHLSSEATRFAEGDFHDPEMIHGEDMPGLHALVMGAAQLDIVYTDIDGGGRIRYGSEDPALIAALHQWFEAQLSDHGAHAQANH
ncbi:MAG: aspartate carbamoyltransferase [Gemmatimonadota bacterium]